MELGVLNVWFPLIGSALNVTLTTKARTAVRPPCLAPRAGARTEHKAVLHALPHAHLTPLDRRTARTTRKLRLQSPYRWIIGRDRSACTRPVMSALVAVHTYLHGIAGDKSTLSA